MAWRTWRLKTRRDDRLGPEEEKERRALEGPRESRVDREERRGGVLPLGGARPSPDRQAGYVLLRREARVLYMEAEEMVLHKGVHTHEIDLTATRQPEGGDEDADASDDPDAREDEQGDEHGDDGFKFMGETSSTKPSTR